MTPVPLARVADWYSAAPSSRANPHYRPSSRSRGRFNDAAGGLFLRYLAAHPIAALREANALYGSYGAGFVPPPVSRRWTVYRYRIVSALSVVDFCDPGSRTGVTDVQQLTGDWRGYRDRVATPVPASLPAVKPGSRTTAPTQQLARRIRALAGVAGFLSPSAKDPLVANLVLFYDLLPPGSLLLEGAATTAI